MDASIKQLIKDNGGVCDYDIAKNINILLEKGKLITAGETILLLTYLKCEDKIKMLLENDVNIDTNYKDKLGTTSLMHASIFGYEEIVKILLRFGADINCKDNQGNTALMYASEFGHYNIVTIFLGYGVDVNSVNNFKHTALSCVLNKYGNIAKILIKYNANVNICDSLGNTMLFYATDEFIDILTENNSVINNVNKDGQTALIWYINENYKYGCNTKIIRKLLKNGADVNHKDKFGKTAVDYAIEYKIETIFELLGIKNVDPSNNFHLIMNSITEHIETCKISKNIVASHYDKKIKT